MMSEDKKSPKQRKRVPLACLICKKRKVKCDKQKPTCSECIRNGVAHMCEYLEPHWSSGGDSKSVKREVENVEDSEEYKSLKATNDRVIHTQRKEIEDLRRQLSVLQQLSPPKAEGSPGTKPSDGGHELSSAITVLNKLCPTNINANARKNYLIVDDYNYSIVSHNINKPTPYTDTYSWINLIKLDPQLTSLWYKITNLQKIYHTYKMNLLIESKNTIRSPAKKSDYRINEIDFTYSVSPIPKTEDNSHRCPVIECDFNFMSEEQDQTTPSRSSSPFPTTLKIEPSIRTKQEEVFMRDFEDIDEKAKKPLIRIQNLWDSTLHLVRGNEPLNYKQLYYLIDFYFNDIRIESKNLVSFFKIEIQSMIKKNTNEVSLNLSDEHRSTNAKDLSDQALYERLLTKGVYLCFLALIIDESLEILRTKFRTSQNDTSYEKFRMLFPSEVVYLNDDTKEGSIMKSVHEFLLIDRNLRPVSRFSPDANGYSKLSPNSIRPIPSTPSLAHLSCCILLLNRGILGYRKGGSTSDTKSGFTSIFTHLLNSILNENEIIELWKDPDFIVLKDSKKKNKELKIHLCYLWTDLVRLANLVSFNFIPILKHSSNLDSVLQKLYTKIEESHTLQGHVRYLSELKSSKYDLVKSNLQVHYLIAKISCALSFGIKNYGEISLTVSNLKGLVKECDDWINTLETDLEGFWGSSNEPRVDGQNRSNLDSMNRGAGVGQKTGSLVRKFEVFSILNYLRYFMKYVTLLQSENNLDEVLARSLIPDLFTDIYSFVSHIRKIDLIKGRTWTSQYVLSSVIELMTRVIQFVVGLLIRFRNGDPSSTSDNVLKRELDKMKSEVDGKILAQFGCDTEEFVNVKIVEVIEDTVNALDKSVVDKDKANKLSKLWKFYMTFIANSTKMNVINYEKLHSNVPEFKVDSSSMKACPVINSGAVKIKGEEFKKCPISLITTPMDTDFSPSEEITRSGGKCPVNHASIAGSKPGGRCPIDHSALGAKPINFGSFGVKSVSHNTSGARCPVSHNSVGKCPVNHGGFDAAKSPLGRCPVTHLSPNTVESRKRKFPFDHNTWSSPSIGQGLESNIRGKIQKESPSQPSSPMFKVPTPKSSEIVQVPAPLVISAVPEVTPEVTSVELPPPIPAIPDRQAFNDFDFDVLHNDSFFDQLNFGFNMDSMSIEGLFQ